MLLWMDRFPIGCVSEQHRRRRTVAPVAIIADVNPTSARLRRATAGAQHGNRRVIGMQLRGLHDVLRDAAHEGIQQHCGLPDPVGECRAREFDAFTLIDLTLPIQRLVIAVFGDQHVRENRRAHHTALDRPVRRRSLQQCLATRAGELRAHVADDFVASRDAFEDLRDILACGTKGAAAIGTRATARYGSLVNHRLARQMLGNSRARRAIRGGSGCSEYGGASSARKTLQICAWIICA